MQPGVLRDLLQSKRLGMLRQDIEQLHHALDHLDRILSVLLGTRGMHGHSAL